MRFAVETHGCRLNQAESDALIEQLRARGHQQVEGPEQAEIVVHNSCTITHPAAADARAALRRAARRSPGATIVVTGCYANAEPERLAEMAEVDAVIGNLEKRGPELVDRLERAGQGSGFVSVERLSRRARPRPWTAPAALAPARTRPLLKIQDGCDYQCSFCVVPRVRGRSRSLAVEGAVTQLRELVEAGHPEVVLTGAHLGLWGRDLSPPGRRPSSLADLIAALLAQVPGARLRLGSVDPHEVDEGLISLIARGLDESGAGLCPHLHLPIQSGDDGVLRAMRRAHTVADLERLIPALRRAAPTLALGTDVIVGFPGESDAAFERTLALFERWDIPFAHVFCWSPRAGTAAEALPDRVAPELAAARSRTLRRQVAASRRRFERGQIGRVCSAVVLRRRDRRSGELVALTANYLRVRVAGPDRALGRRVALVVESLDGRGLGGRILERELA